MAKAKKTTSIDDIKRLLRPSGALLAAQSDLGTAIEQLVVAKTQYSSATLDLLVRLRLAPNGQLRGIDLVRQLHMSPGYVSRLIDRAEADGLISRQADPHDRRAQLLTLTPGGERVFDDFAPAVLEVLEGTIYTALSADEVDVLVDLLARISTQSQHLLSQPEG
jgi:DNA-binding MarR family transcriptional regulator